MRIEFTIRHQFEKKLVKGIGELCNSKRKINGIFAFLENKNRNVVKFEARYFIIIDKFRID